MLPFTLLVNSTDGYADCWEPFFKLMAIYWPQYQAEIVLNAERKTYAQPGLHITCTQNAAAFGGKHPTWTEALQCALAQVPTDLVLYVQEDYFLKAPVQHEALVSLAEAMQRHQITYLGLTPGGNQGPFVPSGFDERLWKVSQQDKYRISLQACMFSKSRFAKYLRRHENPWHFEYYGNIRARRKQDSFYTLNREIFGQDNQVFPYDMTGIVSRQWKRDVVEDLFARHNIAVDFTKRGWFGEDPPVERFQAPWSIDKVVGLIKSLV